MIRSITLLFIIFVVVMNSSILLNMEAVASDKKKESKKVEEGAKPCPRSTCPFGLPMCRVGLWCQGTCSDLEGTEKVCQGIHIQEVNELLWFCPNFIMHHCGCEDPCVPVGISGLRNLVNFF